MSDARRYAVWPEPRSRSRSLKGSRPSVPHGTNFLKINPVNGLVFVCLSFHFMMLGSSYELSNYQFAES